MKDSKAPRVGVLECTTGSASFYVNDFSFYIMNNVMKKGTTPSGETYTAANCPFTLKKQGNFLTGFTTNRESIAIYAKDYPDNFSISQFTLRASIYVIQNAIQTETSGYFFDAIELRGGMLNNLFSDRFIQVDYSNSNYIIKRDSFELVGNPVLNNQPVSIKVGWFTHENSQSRKLEISTTNPYFRFEFNKPINLDDALLHIEKARELMSFLSYRNNVEFDSICFQRKSVYTDSQNISHEYYRTDAHAFINYGFESSQKESCHCICFDDIGNPVFNLLAMFYDHSDYNPVNHLNFIPKSDKDSDFISSTTIREIATFLECEEAWSIKNRDEKSHKLYDENQRLSNLLSKIKQVIKEDEDENGPLPNSVQNQLSKRFQNVSLPSKSKDILLYESYRDITINITRYFSYYKILDSSDIKKFRDYRNKETHGNYNLFSLDIGMTALHLVATVYCSILHRAGVDDQKLKSICEKNFIL